MIILGIETSCDETSAAVVTDQKEIRSNVLLTQLEIHSVCGGVIPEVAARAHLDHLNIVIDQALTDADLTLNDIDGIAATAGPGLIGGLIVGVTTAKSIALACRLPFLAVNHLAGHALTVRLTHDIEFPYLLLLVSGGHCQLMVVNSPQDYDILGETLDDAVGEAFDKVAKLLDLPYPGGPEIEKLAARGNPHRFNFPRPLLLKKEAEFVCSFSLSGLKTAVRQTVLNQKIYDTQDKADCAASFQYTIGEILKNRVLNAIKVCHSRNIALDHFVVAGGVASNQYLRHVLCDAVQDQNLKFVAPPLNLCTDNAAMIAWAGIEKMHLNQIDDLGFAPQPRWPLIKLNDQQIR
ncbi:MAG: tRNA (adenosine(37)-N6)-threonylcarbamoyltransferase complex transferase subunit TsaD [Janthinobacterium lividum]